MNTLVSILLSILNNTAADHVTREIARQFLKAYPDYENIKAVQIAERSFCNISTVNRFCKSLGFKNFGDMKAYMSTGHHIRQGQLAHHMSLADREKIISNIRVLANSELDEKAFLDDCRNFNETIRNVPYTVVIGAVFPEAMTFHYMEDMIEMGRCIYNAPIQRRLIIPQEDPQAGVILISFSGRLVTHCAEEFNEIIERFPHMIIMTGNRDIQKGLPAEKIFRLPFDGDDECNNAAFIEIMRYLKFDYYQRYYGNK